MERQEWYCKSVHAARQNCVAKEGMLSFVGRACNCRLTSGDIKDSPPDCYVHWLVWICAIMLFQLAEGQLLKRDHLDATSGKR